MKEYTILMICLLGMVLTGCHSHETDPKLEEAFKIHEQAIAVNQAIQSQLQSANTETPEMSQIKKRLSDWEENLVEVPGFDHDHDHSHGGHHHHDHGPGLEVTPEDMLIIQKEFLDSIKVIQQEVQLYLK